jgi:signal peptidase I
MLDLANHDTKSTIWWIIAPIVIILLILLWFQIAFQSFVVDGSSMEHSLQDGQVILINKAAYWFSSPKRGDIVVYRSRSLLTENKIIIHRVVALPDEWVQVIDGIAYIRDNETEPWVKLDEPYAWGDKEIAPRHVPEGYYFILGDNRAIASVELVPEGNIIGKAWLSIWPLSKWGLAPNYSY